MRALIVILLVCGTIAAIVWNGRWTSQTSSYQTSVDPSAPEWHALVDKATNAYFMWREDALLGRVADMFGYDHSLAYAILSLLIFCAGSTLFLCLLLTNERPLLNATIASVLLSSVLFHLFGSDHVLLSAITWVPWLLYFIFALTAAAPKQFLAFVVLMLFVIYRATVSANQLAFLIALVCLVAALRLRRELGTPNMPKASLRLALLLLLPTLFMLYQAPPPPLPDYPALAHVVPDDGLPGMVRPLVGYDLPIPFIDRAAVRNVAPACWIIFALGIATMMLLYNRALPAARTLASLSCACAFFCVLDSAAPESIAHISPIAAFSRVVPGMIFLSLTSLVAALALMFGVWGCCTAGVEVIAATSLFLLSLLPHTREPSVSAAEFSPAEMKILASPSYAVIRSYGIGTLKKRTLYQAAKEFPLTADVATASAFPRSEERSMERMLDPKPNSRWTPQQGRQLGNEWLHITLREPLTFIGIEVDPGALYKTDFPRGIRISANDSCSDAPSDRPSGYRVLFEQKEWQGALRFTSDGFPYYGGQGEVRAYFPEAVTTRCILVEQIGHDEHFDWSIASVNLLK